MLSLSNMPSATAVFSAYTSLTASAMLVRAVANEAKSMVDQFIPQHLQIKILSMIGAYYEVHPTPEFTLVINEYSGCTVNEMYEASEVYLRTKSTAPSLQRLTVSKQPKEKNLTVAADKDQDVVDVFEGIQIIWRLICPTNDSPSNQNKFYELTFDKQFKDVVLGSYLPYVLTRSKDIHGENTVIKLYSQGFYGGDDDGVWGSVNLNHPTTFDTLAMETNLKKDLLDDLDRFVKRKEFYKRVGKPWKRGYLLYGPPGTGKSSLVAAMANYLNFNIYDLELANIYNNSELRRLMVATKNRSILVIEDIDCNIQLKARRAAEGFDDEDRADAGGSTRLTLSGLLNSIDGLWSSCGDERIIIFTTNHKDKLDPALLRPGRMDRHIHMSYCTPCGFKILASNYLQIQSDPLFGEIESLIEKVNVTPAEIAEELMRSDDVQTSLKGLIDFLQKKKTVSSDEGDKKNSAEQKTTNQKSEPETESDVEQVK